MTVKSVDLQVLVPRAGEVERINRTVQGQQQTDQQIMSQGIQENLKQQTQVVNQTQATEQKKIEKEAQEKNKENKKQKEESVNSGSGLETTEQKKEEQKTNAGRYLDIKI
ncbi:MAG TPA: hypothetical protein GX532_01260 [Clostridia bacterium]|jgi:hypothetical protein|nr:hypothetical protein [Clostridia bacterium]HHY05594.1 hypothetical protein [Clostridia bacterium]